MWYQDAVIYALDVEKFYDGNGDGIGDFQGLTEKLPYLRSLGVTCLWLLPFYDTPDRDNGYDIRDYYRINPKAGTLQDFITFIQKSGEQGIRVIADLVVNHTSDEHPWFQAARRDPKSRFRDYYVWTERPPRLEADDQTIFPGEEDSVWTYDEVASSYYFHRFYHYQPDLNVANPNVRQEIIKIIDYWMALGVAGFRVDAAPIIVGENGLDRSAPEDPNGPLREMHETVCARREDALLLGEANVPPEQISRFFGEGDQLGLLFNFFLNAHLYLALAREEAAPIQHAITLLPVPPERCGWANFLRTLDELDLSRLSDKDRFETYEVFAPEKRMRLYNRGIRRRLAPMFEGDQRRLELINSLLFSLPGAPTLIYGDEIGMGEDLDEKGRNSVRLPMQWSTAKNGGFSSAPPREIIQPVLKDGPFAPRHINVEKQNDDPSSLLNKVRRFSQLRRDSVAIKRAPLSCFDTGHQSVFGHRCQHEGGGMLFLHNLSRRKAKVDFSVGLSGRSNLKDLLSDEVISLRNGHVAIELEPHQYMWTCLVGKSDN